MKSEHGKTNASCQARSQLHLSEGAATKLGLHVTDLGQLQGAPKVIQVLAGTYNRGWESIGRGMFQSTVLALAWNN
jgi:hypothetical protein